MVEWMGYPMYYAFDGASPPPRAGAAHATIYPYGPFPTGDGRTVMLGLQNEREWIGFCEHVLQQPSLAQDPRYASNPQRSQARDKLRALIVSAFAPLTIEQIEARLDAGQIAHARVNDMAAVWSHPQLHARERWVDIDTPAGAVPALLPPGLATLDDCRMDGVPALGAHTEAILAELGHNAAAIAALRAAHVV
jgi:crotonobetainyl-CoA:carnitine CoA-transferase CaiB-like acyl-CoA transferase